ncbi:phage protein [Leminorella grimontii]|uniref:phage protein n=1 Tax=Leminorella grimontii TaxID=82981 RepID=UPI0032203B1A
MLFNRVAELVVGEANGKAVIINDLRFSFEITKDNDKTTNKLALKIYNMNNQTRNLVERVNNNVILKAGYEDDIGPVTIFTGTVVSAWTVREGNDTITELSVRDGALPLRQTKLSLSYSPGTSALDILHDVAESFGLPVKAMPENIVDKPYQRGFSFCGRAETAMRDICQYLGLTWSIQNHEIQILSKDNPIGDELVVLTPENGLVGIPTRIVDSTRNKSQGESSPPSQLILSESQSDKTQYQIEGYRVKSLLQPRLYPGCYVGLESDMLLLDPSADKDRTERPRAFFRAEVVTHSGDTFQGDWVTECELKSIQQRKDNGGK